MTTDEKWAFLLALDDEYLLGGVMLSEWTTFLVREVDTAFCNHANLTAILAAQSAIECHLRYENSGFHAGSRLGFYELIEQSPFEASLKTDMHKLRRFRNTWVHVNDPYEDQHLLSDPEIHENEIEEVALFSMRLIRRALYLEQCI